MNRLRPSLTVCPAPRVTRRRVLRRQELNAYHRQGTHDVTTRTTLPVQGDNIWFAVASLEGVRQVNPDGGAKTVEVDFDPGFIGSDGIRRGLEDIEYRVVAS